MHQCVPLTDLISAFLRMAWLLQTGDMIVVWTRSTSCRGSIEMHNVNLISEKNTAAVKFPNFSKSMHRTLSALSGLLMLAAAAAQAQSSNGYGYMVNAGNTNTVTITNYTGAWRCSDHSNQSQQPAGHQHRE